MVAAAVTTLMMLSSAVSRYSQYLIAGTARLMASWVSYPRSEVDQLAVCRMLTEGPTLLGDTVM